MIKRYCDGCGEELTPAFLGPRNINNRFATDPTVKASGLMLEVITGKDGTWNSGDWCRLCIAAGLAKLIGFPGPSTHE